MKNIPESDWKKLKELNAKAIERYCLKAIEGLKAILADIDKTPQERFLETCLQADRKKRKLAEVFDGLRRSTAFMNLCQLRSLGLITDDELSLFTKETKEMVEKVVRG